MIAFIYGKEFVGISQNNQIVDHRTGNRNACRGIAEHARAEPGTDRSGRRRSIMKNYRRARP